MCCQKKLLALDLQQVAKVLADLQQLVSRLVGSEARRGHALGDIVVVGHVRVRVSLSVRVSVRVSLSVGVRVRVVGQGHGHGVVVGHGHHMGHRHHHRVEGHHHGGHGLVAPAGL